MYLYSPCFPAVDPRLWIEGFPSPRSAHSCTPQHTPFLEFATAYVPWGSPHAVGRTVTLGSVPFFAGTKGLECSPSTPTMNSYFYKFMINLLKRFSSERKLLEARGAFIIRSDSARVLFLTATFSHCAPRQG